MARFGKGGLVTFGRGPKFSEKGACTLSATSSSSECIFWCHFQSKIFFTEETRKLLNFSLFDDEAINLSLAPISFFLRSTIGGVWKREIERIRITVSV